MTEIITFPYAGLDVEVAVEIEPHTQGLWQNGVQITPDEGGVTTEIKSITICDDDGTYYNVTTIIHEKHCKKWSAINTEAQEQAEEEYGGS